MSAPGRFNVLRPFMLAGEPIGRDRVLNLDDGQLISTLLEAGRIEAADRATEARIKRQGVEWTPAEPHQLRSAGSYRPIEW